MNIEEHGEIIICSKTLWMTKIGKLIIKLEEHYEICECAWCRDFRYSHRHVWIRLKGYASRIIWKKANKIYLFKIY